MESETQVTSEEANVQEWQTRIGKPVRAINIPGSHLLKAVWDHPGPLPEELSGTFTNRNFVERAVDQYNARHDNAALQAKKQKQVKLLNKEGMRVKNLEAENKKVKKHIQALNDLVVYMILTPGTSNV